jgi:cobalamin biosynthesis protein CbiG
VSGFVVGAGCSRGCPAIELLELIEHVLGEAGIAREQVGALATIDTRAEEPALVEIAGMMQWPLQTYPAQQLATVEVPTPSSVVASHAGTPSVAEAAALLSARRGRVVVPKQRSTHATCALAEVIA